MHEEPLDHGLLSLPCPTAGALTAMFKLQDQELEEAQSMLTSWVLTKLEPVRKVPA